MELVFEWNPEKARSNLRKHGVSFKEAITVFSDKLARIVTDEDHSDAELREIVIGHSLQQRLLFVNFTARNNRIRIFSARQTTRKERIRYEEYNLK